MRPAVFALTFAFIGFIVGAVFFTAVSLVLAWTGPTSAPPNGNVSAPINVGTTAQLKNGGLGINSLAVFGNAILAGASSYLNFGTTAGSSGYGIRDNTGTMEFKNSGGSWASIQSTVSTLVGSGGGQWTTNGSSIYYNGGNVGISSTNPAYPLDVNGAIAAGNSDIYFTNTTHNHTGIGNTAGYAAIENATNFNTLMILGRSGGIGGVRSVSVWDRLDVNGTLWVTGSVTATGGVKFADGTTQTTAAPGTSCGAPLMEVTSCRSSYYSYEFQACNFRVCNNCGCGGWNPGGTQIIRAAPGY